MSTETPRAHRYRRFLEARPMRGTLAERMLTFFENNPDEELSRKDLIVKFDAKDSAMDCALAKLRAQGVLECVRVVRLRSKGIAK